VIFEPQYQLFTTNHDNMSTANHLFLPTLTLQLYSKTICSHESCNTRMVIKKKLGR